MGKVLVSLNLMTDIADAVRSRTGTTEKLTASEIAAAIKSLSTGAPLDVLAPGYSSAKTYTIGDLVTHQDAFYVCTANIYSPEGFDSSHWSTATVAEVLSTILKAGVADDKYY